MDRKWAILAAALLLAAGTFVRVRQQRRAEEASRLQPAQVLPAGQPLPADTTRYYIPEEFMAVPPRTGAPDGYGALPTIKNPIYDRGPCKGGSLNDILSSHGRTWGYDARHGAFRPEETDEIYDLAARYLACVGLAQRSPSYCDYLPAERGSIRDLDYSQTPNYRCREYYMGVSMPGYAAGRETSMDACAIFLTSSELSAGRRLSSADLCSAASRGIAAVCPKFAPAISGEELRQCRALFPGSEADCGPDRACRYRLDVARAMKAGDPAACPEKARGLCGAFLSRSEAGCSLLLVNLSNAYCRSLASAQKRAGGYAGYTPDEVAAAIKQEAAAKAAEEAQRKEQRRVEEELNKRVRQMMGKQADK